nr:EOG090X0G3U [Cyclestheria hislopi]
MSERKVLNKYYPPDFDPSKIPRVRQPKNRQFTVRLMAPFNMKCTTCGEYIYKGKKFNARKEDVENESYLGIRIYRFYIKCTRCLSEISFKTDPASTDYEVEAGATRNFMALKLAEEQALREIEAEKEEEKTNPMKLLENRTKASRGEIEMVETLEELKELNKRKVAINYDAMLNKYDEHRQTEAERQELEDEELVKSIFGERSEAGQRVKRIAEDDGDSDEEIQRPTKTLKNINKPTDLLAAATSLTSVKKTQLSTLVKVKKPTSQTPVQPSVQSSSSGSSSSSTNSSQNSERGKPLGSLSLLGSYSGSDSDST